jgi:hypothetical protein
LLKFRTKRPLARLTNMRLINVEIEGAVLVSVKFRADLLIRADDDASIEKAIRSWANGRHYSKADVEDASLMEVLEVGGKPVEEFDLGEAVSAALESGLGGIKIKDYMVTDSR